MQCTSILLEIGLNVLVLSARGVLYYNWLSLFIWSRSSAPTLNAFSTPNTVAQQMWRCMNGIDIRCTGLRSTCGEYSLVSLHSLCGVKLAKRTGGKDVLTVELCTAQWLTLVYRVFDVLLVGCIYHVCLSQPLTFEREEGHYQGNVRG